MSNTKHKRKMFISVLPGEQVEVAIAENDLLQEYYVEMLHQVKTRGNIYKAKIHNIDASLQAAFINYGAERNGFLQIDEVHPDYYQAPHNGNGKYPPIQKILRKNQELLVQVVKEPVAAKGAFLTSYLSLPGRYLILTPGREQLGVSRKIEDEEERKRLKEIVGRFKLEDGLGLIVRTASKWQSKRAMEQDFSFLKRLWKEIRTKGTKASSPALIYQETDLAARAVRDYLTEDIGEIWVDDPETAEQVKASAALVFPRRTKIVKPLQESDENIWDKFNLRKQIEGIYSREVPMPCGGRLVFDCVEALTAVDINSGKIGGENNFKEMALRTNLDATKAIAQQLRLRDIGGQIVIDFIEMKDKNHIAEVEKSLKNALKSDRARIDVGKISRFGLLEMVRQRLASSAISSSTEPCKACHGSGNIRNLEWRAMLALKELLRLLRKETNAESIHYKAPQDLAFYLLNRKRERLCDLEARFGKSIIISEE